MSIEFGVFQLLDPGFQGVADGGPAPWSPEMEGRRCIVGVGYEVALRVEGSASSNLQSEICITATSDGVTLAPLPGPTAPITSTEVSKGAGLITTIYGFLYCPLDASDPNCNVLRDEVFEVHAVVTDVWTGETANLVTTFVTAFVDWDGDSVDDLAQDCSTNYQFYDRDTDPPAEILEPPLPPEPEPPLKPHLIGCSSVPAPGSGTVPLAVAWCLALARVGAAKKKRSSRVEDEPRV